VFALGPKLLVNIGDVPATNLLQPGNRATYRLLVAARGNMNALDAYRTWLNGELKAGSASSPSATCAPRCGQTLERAEKFVGLAALVAVLLAAVAVALAASRYLRRHWTPRRCSAASARASGKPWCSSSRSSSCSASSRAALD
jgi:putative ABC transport system permease protein